MDSEEPEIAAVLEEGDSLESPFGVAVLRPCGVAALADEALWLLEHRLLFAGVLALPDAE